MRGEIRESVRGVRGGGGFGPGVFFVTETYFETFFRRPARGDGAERRERGLVLRDARRARGHTRRGGERGGGGDRAVAVRAAHDIRQAPRRALDVEGDADAPEPSGVARTRRAAKHRSQRARRRRARGFCS